MGQVFHGSRAMVFMGVVSRWVQPAPDIALRYIRIKESGTCSDQCALVVFALGCGTWDEEQLLVHLFEHAFVFGSKQ